MLGNLTGQDLAYIVELETKIKRLESDNARLREAIERHKKDLARYMITRADKELYAVLDKTTST